MTIQMVYQRSLEQLLLQVKQFKRTGQHIAEMIRKQRNQQAIILLQQEQKNITKIQNIINSCSEGYLNPDSAKRLIMIKQQFKDQREKLARLFHSVRVEDENTQQTKQQQIQCYDYEVESRLLRQKGESLTQIHKKMKNIQSVVDQTHQMTHKQGEQLDLITDQLDTTKSNVSAANEDLSQAMKLSGEKNRRWWWLLLVLILICVILTIILFY